MAIDLKSEKGMTAAAAAQWVIERTGRSCHTDTIYRWFQRGLRGVRLEVIQVGGTKCTSVEALERFFTRLESPDATLVQASSGTGFQRIHEGRTTVAVK